VVTSRLAYITAVE